MMGFDFGLVWFDLNVDFDLCLLLILVIHPMYGFWSVVYDNKFGNLRNYTFY